jgi:hypothetical protein
LTNTWFYEQVLQETAGTEVRFTNRVDTFDGVTINTLSGLNLVVPANGTLTLKSRWCSAYSSSHVAQSTFIGTDAAGHSISVTAPEVHLQAK